MPSSENLASDMLAPETEEAVVEAVRAAFAAREAIAIEGNGSKRGLLRPVTAPRGLTTRRLTGITLQRPTELIIQARAGTPVPEIEAALAAHGQMLIAEPPDTSALFGSTLPATLGGIVATNLSGPRRITGGATRDHVMGIRMVNGTGEVVRSGGRVLKNVTGLDLCKLLTGSHGTLGVLTEVTIKIQPAPEAVGTLAVRVGSLAEGVAALSAGLGSPYGVSGAALLPEGAPGFGLQGPTALLRLEDFSTFVTYRAGKLRELVKGFGPVALLEGDPARALWRQVRDAVPLGAAPEQAIWRVSVRPSAAAGLAEGLREALDAPLLLDWGGGLVWIAGPATEAAHAAVMRAATLAQGSFTLFRAPESLRAAVPVLPAEPAPLAAITARVKAALDPAGLFNPGRMHR